MKQIFNFKAIRQFFSNLWKKVFPISHGTLASTENPSNHNSPKENVDKNQIVHTYGIDVYGYYGENRVTPTLSLEASKRERFKKNNPLTDALLRRSSRQTLLEEGYWTENDSSLRAFKGEEFLTYEAMALLVHKRIIERAKTDKRYDARNVFVTDDLKQEDVRENLIAGMKTLSLQPGQDAKFIFTHGIHAIPTYIRNIDGKVHVFIAESFGDMRGTQHILTALKETFDNPTIIRSSTPVQADFYSCSTFALKTMIYMAKHGKDIFPYINKPEYLKGKDEDGCFILAADKLPPTLLKLARKNIALPEEEHTNANVVVSDKHKTTLKNYHKKAEVIIDSKAYNSKPLTTKYKYMQELNKLLKESKINPDDLIPDRAAKLPARLQIIIDKMSCSPASKNQSQPYTTPGL